MPGRSKLITHFHMNFDPKEWLNLLFRWTHVFAGIMWVGTTYYFTWLDGRFNELERAASSGGKGEDKNVWMVHSGGFYRVEKQTVPSVMPEKLHWFKWEAAITWLSGLLLFIMVYYHGGIMVETEGSRISQGTAIASSVILLALGWAVYDLLWKFCRIRYFGIIASFILVVALTCGLFHFYAARAACLQLGAMFGTIMTANVWMRILPAQRRMVAALKEGKEPNQAEARRAKARSKHNTFIVLPTVFLMLSPHFPGTYHWPVICGLVLAGWLAAMALRRA